MNYKIEKIKRLIETTDLTMAEIRNQVGCRHQLVTDTLKSYPAKYRKARKTHHYRKSKLGDLNPMFNKTRELHPNYKGVVSDNKGYLLILKPEWYTGRKRSKHVFQHSVVVCENLGLTEIPKGFCVHHCDINPLNNDFSNLVMLTMAEHSALHSYLKGATTISKESTLKWVEAYRTAKAVMI